jgi:hypothetical protein
MEVYKAIAAIIGEMAKEGIGKDSTNQQQRWNFRGIDAVYNALAPKLAKHELMIIPRVLSRTCTDRITKNGGNMFYVVVDCEFDFISAKDGSKHTARIFGEAMDSGDKATNKAMSIALKYAAFQTFFIPTEVNTQDPDTNSHEVIVTINEDQQTQLKDYIEENLFKVEQVTGFFNIKSLADIPVSQLESTKQTIKGWIQ